MKKIFFVIITLISINSFAQTQLIGDVKKMPMQDAKAYNAIRSRIEPGDPGIPGVTIKSSNSTVYNITRGQVIALFDFVGRVSICIKGEDNNFYWYSFLNAVYFSKTDEIKFGDIIGTSSINNEDNLFETTIQIADDKSNFLTEDKIWQIIKKLNSIPLAAVCDATMLN